MLLPEPMSRILVVGTKDRLPAAIELLYSLENVHIVDFSPEEEGFTLGSPLHAASDASQQLLKLRSMEKDLEINTAAKPKQRMPVSKIAPNLAASIDQIEAEMVGTVNSKSAKQTRVVEAESRLQALQPFRSIDLDLSAYRGYDSIDVLAGHVRSNPEASLKEALQDEYEIFANPEGTFIALFVPQKRADEAQRILAQNGFTEIAVPDGSGKPAELASALEAEVEGMRKELEAVESDLSALREKHADFILASEEYLSILVEKAELPLRMGASKHSFILEAWVPTGDFDKVTKAFADKFQDSIYIEKLEDRARTEHHEDPSEEKMEAGLDTAEAVSVPISEEVPVKLEHGKGVGRFEFFTKLLSTPRYNEIDPTILVAIFFPIFFGFMVGDVGYGIPFTILGYLGLRMTRSKEWRAISTMLFYGGIASIFFGLFLYGDMFGIEFVAADPHEELSWAVLTGIDIPKTLFSIGGFDVNLGYFTKLGDVEKLLYGTLWIGIAHLLIGLIVGFYNITIRHGLKHAVMDKFSWIMIMVGFALVLLFVVDYLIIKNDPSFTDPRLIIGVVLLLAGLLMAVKAEGGNAIVELPEVMSNVLSYTRLAAIGMSKAGMALAFNFIAIELIAPAGGIMLIMGLLVFVVGHLMIFILAIISAGLHSIRLQYVELFKKFYEGGGLEFNPLKVKRKYTTMEE